MSFEILLNVSGSVIDLALKHFLLVTEAPLVPFPEPAGR